MSCYQGLLEYAEVESAKGRVQSEAASAGPVVTNLVKAAVMAAEDIVKEEINLAGGCASSEAWFHGARLQHLPYARLQETCVTITWMRLCEKLLSVTDDPKWADEIDRTFFNAYLAEPFRPNSIGDGAVCPAFTPVRAPSDDIWMAFAATLPIGAHHANPEGVLPSSVTFCDYASAGNTWRREDYYRTWIPIEYAPWERAPSAMT